MNKRIKSLLCDISPILATRLMFRYNFHKKLNLRCPRNFNEKLQWLKLNEYSGNTIVTNCADKLKVKDYLKKLGYENLVPKLIGGGYQEAEEVKKHWNEYPDRFMIKCNHGSGYNILVRDKRNVNIEEVLLKLNKWLKEDYWKLYCEPQYREIPHRILIEEYLGDNICTYKFYCFNGEPKVVYISSNGEDGEYEKYIDYFDIDWNWLPLSLWPHLNCKEHPKRPRHLNDMINIAKDLAKKFPFCRVDLYNLDGQIRFSELTFVPTGGNLKLSREDILDEWGKWLELPIC